MCMRLSVPAARAAFALLAMTMVATIATAADTLLLTEIVVTPTGGEMVEIHNPTAATIDLTNVYLTDATYATGGTYYYNIVTGANAGGGGYDDFHARFPASASIAAGEYQTVALNGSANFLAEYGVAPTYELYDDGSADGEALMLEAFTGSINGQGGLTNDGEVVILYTWDGASDLVADLDYAVWGDKAEAVDKSGVSIDGPDGDTTPTTYLNDTAITSQDVVAAAAHTFGLTWQRIDLEEGSETPTGGNGQTGHDETSENLSGTWLEADPSPGAGYAAVAARLLLSELVVTPTGGEYIEIHNPNTTAVNLSDYYLTDATYATGGTYYYNIVTGANYGGGSYDDFHARFPDGATIAAGEYQTVALNGSANFITQYAVAPTYELYDDGSADGEALMREAVAGSINGQGGLTNDGEVVILYWWDGATDLVTDIDYALWGDKAEAVDKTGVAVDGPDGDTTPTAYQNDTAIASQDIISDVAHAGGEAFKRTNLSEGSEVQTGGNGVGGADETSEDLSVTWSVDTPPNPGEGEPSGWVINEVLADPAGDITGDANGDGTRDSSQDEFVEIVNVSGSDVDISGWILSDSYQLRHTFPVGTQIPAGCGIVVFGGGTPTGTFGYMTVQVASSGALGLNNDGDTVTLSDGITNLAVMTYGAEGAGNQSLTLDPDLTGPAYVQHSSASGSGGALFSPGTMINGTDFSGCVPPPEWVINEIHADPDPTVGDANGDGAIGASDDEFVEIINNSGGDLDIGGWTLSDGTAVRHTFPAATVVSDGCGIVVFGGGTPIGTFGACLVQIASTGTLDLDDSGDSVALNDGASDVATASYGAEGGDNQSLTRDPDVTGLSFVKHTLATGSGGTIFSPGTKVDGWYFLGCPLPVMEIYQIQGAGWTTPYEGYTVTTYDNIVTAVGLEGFFIQTPDARDDADIDTSNGIYVLTGTAPTVAVGDQVDVSGVVGEFYDFTEIGSSPWVSIDSSGNPLPAVVTFDATRPSPDPTTPSCAIEYECYEGMLVSVTGGRVCGPNQRFGVDPVAEFHVTAGPDRCLREKGVAYPGWPPPPVLPVWDGNPEVFEVDPDWLGGANQIVPAGSTFDAVGPLGYEYGGYEIFPTSLTVTPATLPLAVRDRVAGEVTVSSFNMYRLYDDIDDPGTEDDNDVLPTAEYERRLDKHSQYIRTVLKAPDIIGVEEVEKQAVLDDLAAKILLDDPSVVYTGYLVEGNDGFGMDVGFLVRDSVQVDTVTQLGATEIFSFPGRSDTLLHDRPPLLLEGQYLNNGLPFALAVMVNHTRSMNGIEENNTDGEWRRTKRLTQAQSIAQKAQDYQTTYPDARLIVAGDLNAFEFTDGLVDVVGQIAGDFDPAENLHSDSDLVDPNLSKQVLSLPAQERYSFNRSGNAQALDHALTTVVTDHFVRGMEYGRANADAAFDLIDDGSTLLRCADHDALVLFLMTDRDGDGVADDVDPCPDDPDCVPVELMSFSVE